MKNFIFLLLTVSCLISCSDGSSNLNLISHWSLDGHADDLSSYKSHGTIYGDPEQVDGVIKGKALDFNGDDYIEIGVDGESPPHLKELATGSISLWFKARTWDIQTTILPILYYGRSEMCPEAFDGTNGGLLIEVGHGGIFPSENVFFTVYDKACEYPTMCFDSHNGAGIIEPEKWYHFVVSVGEDYNVGYLNGQELLDRRYNFQSDSTSLFFRDFVSHDKMWIGKGFWKDRAVYFDGLIDDVRIYGKPLDEAEVKKLYSAKR